MKDESVSKCIEMRKICDMKRRTYLTRNYFPASCLKEWTVNILLCKGCVKTIGQLWILNIFNALVHINVDRFITNNGIDLILYKGGTIEKDFCQELYNHHSILNSLLD